MVAHEAAVFGIEDHAPPCGDDGIWCRGFAQGCAFAASEAFPAFASYDVRHAFARRFVEMDVRIHVGAAKPSGKGSAERRFSGGARSDQIDGLLHDSVLG